MKKALINPIDTVQGKSVVVAVSDQEFEASTQYFWVDCPDNIEVLSLYSDNQFYPPYTPPAPIPTAEENKAVAIQKLKSTDWVEVPSVSDSSKTPHLLNYNEFLTYRLQARDRAVNPQEGNLQWIAKPKEQWST